MYFQAVQYVDFLPNHGFYYFIPIETRSAIPFTFMDPS